MSVARTIVGLSGGVDSSVAALLLGWRFLRSSRRLAGTVTSGA